MKFRTWIEAEAGLGAGFPEMQPPVNRGSATPASDEVLRTGLQPQVDSQEIHTDQKDEQDKIQAIDGALKRADSEMPQGKQDSKKLSKFKELWDKLKEKWEDLKFAKKETPDEPDIDGLGTTKGDERMIQMMQQNPNAILTGPNQVPMGPGLH